MFKHFLKEIIDNDMIEQYDEVVSVVTLCSGLRATPSDAAEVSQSLMRHSNISYRQDLYIDRAIVNAAYYDIVMLINPSRPTRDKYKATHLGNKYELEQFSQSIIGWKGVFTSPLPKTPKLFHGEATAYQRTKDEVCHGVRLFAIHVLHCTPVDNRSRL
jgi:hypothetical protein